MHKRSVPFVAATLVGLIVVLAAAGRAAAPLWQRAAPSRPAASASTKAKPAAGFDMLAYSTTDVRSIWVVVNKRHPFNPIRYAPAQLTVPNIPLRTNITGDERQVSAVIVPSLERMVTAAQAQGVRLNLQSGYRSYAFQVNLYNAYVRTQGQASADRQSARPGYSEHQTGLAADLGGTSNPACDVAPCFADTIEGKWLAAHAYEYGFIIRYPSDKEVITGYEYEPWHIRYIGTALAAEMHRRGIQTLEEFFGIGGGAQYS